MWKRHQKLMLPLLQLLLPFLLLICADIKSSYGLMHSIVSKFSENCVFLSSHRGDLDNFANIKELHHLKPPSVLKFILFGSALYFQDPKYSFAREKGAFEMDAEFYIKDLLDYVGIKGSKTTTAQIGFQKKPIYKTPRILDNSFASNVVHIVLTSISDISKTPIAELINSVNKQINSTLQDFRSFVPITTESVTDQYYFDMLLYLYYLEAGKLIPKSEDRVRLRYIVGQRILSLLQRDFKVLYLSPSQQPSDPDQLVNRKYANGLRKLAEGITTVLNVFKSTGIIDNYKFDVDDFVDEEYAYSSFEEVILETSFYGNSYC